MSFTSTAPRRGARWTWSAETAGPGSSWTPATGFRGRRRPGGLHRRVSKRHREGPIPRGGDGRKRSGGVWRLSCARLPAAGTGPFRTRRWTPCASCGGCGGALLQGAPIIRLGGDWPEADLAGFCLDSVRHSAGIGRDLGSLDSDYQSATRLLGLGQSALWDHRSGAGASGQQEQRLTEETWSMQIFPAIDLRGGPGGPPVSGRL